LPLEYWPLLVSSLVGVLIAEGAIVAVTQRR
jgi:hypothetical protein